MYKKRKVAEKKHRKSQKRVKQKIRDQIAKKGKPASQG